MRKISFILLLVTPSFYISAQEFNEAYLESLPEAVRNDISERMIEKKVSEKDSYRLSETDSDIKKTPNKDKILSFSDISELEFAEMYIYQMISTDCNTLKYF